MTKYQIAIIDAAKSKRKFDWGEVVSGFKIYACHEGQLDILASTAKFTAAFAGAQGGKTALIPHWLYKRQKEHTKAEPFRALIVSPTVPMRKQSQIIEHIENFYNGTELQGKNNKGDCVYRFPNGSEFLFRTSENPVNLDAGVYHACVIDEAAKVSKQAWERIKVRASANDAPVLTVSTPDIASAIYDEFIANTQQVAEGERAGKKYYMRTWANIARPGFSMEAYEDAKRTMSRAMFDRMFRGIFTHFEGLVYECFGDPKDPHYPVITTPAKLPSPAICTIGGLDFGFAKDPNACVLGAHCEDGVIYIVDEHYKHHEDNDQLAASLLALKAKWEVPATYKFSEELRSESTVIYCDTEDPKAIQTLQQYGINARGKRVQDIVPSIATVNAMFRAGRLKIFDCCTHLIDELKKYQWDTDSRDAYKDNPKGGEDHSSDSLRYCVASHMVRKQITVLNPVQIVTPEEAKERALETAIRLGQVSEDPEERRIQQVKAEQLQQRQWRWHLMNCDE